MRSTAILHALAVIAQIQLTSRRLSQAFFQSAVSASKCLHAKADVSPRPAHALFPPPADSHQDAQLPAGLPGIHQRCHLADRHLVLLRKGVSSRAAAAATSPPVSALPPLPLSLCSTRAHTRSLPPSSHRLRCGLEGSSRPASVTAWRTSLSPQWGNPPSGSLTAWWPQRRSSPRRCPAPPPAQAASSSQSSARSPSKRARSPAPPQASSARS